MKDWGGYGVLRKPQSSAAPGGGGRCGALGARSCPQHRCVSLSHAALLASGSAEEALQHTQAVHHHQCLHKFVCVRARERVCALSQSV